MDFNQRHVMITGGSSGIGKATACLLANQGANLSLIARTPSQLDVAVQEITAAQVQSDQQVIALTADVADQEALTQSIQTATTQLGPPDVLITAAGMARPGYFQEIPLDVFEQTMAVNYFGTLYAIKAVLPLMEERQQGHIVLISSGAGLVGLFGYTPYSPSKFALRGLAESLRGELKGTGIGLSIVYPPIPIHPNWKQRIKPNLQRPKISPPRRRCGSRKLWPKRLSKGLNTNSLWWLLVWKWGYWPSCTVF